MGYMHIENLYRRPEFLTGPDQEVYALEKIHGTSAHLRFAQDGLHLFSGGAKSEEFAKLFDEADLVHRAAPAVEQHGEITVYGEAYGGKQQGMRETYGDELRFVAFDVLPGNATLNGHRVGWMCVPEARVFCGAMDLDFVPYVQVPCTLAALNEQRDEFSLLAAFRGKSEKLREGIVIRPLVERCRPDGQRVIYKHKRDEFRETKAPRVDVGRIQVLKDAQAIADEWVTEERLNHVLDHMAACALDVTSIKTTGEVVRAVFDDVRREGEGEIIWSKDAERAVGTRAAKLYKARLALA